jgi:succinate dehydrogenase / fumarate reductase membrane anchor subunit
MSAPLDPVTTDAVDERVDADDMGPDPETDGDRAASIAAAVAPQPWAWHVVRVSGLFLAALIVWHALVTFVLGDVGQTTAVTVSSRWRDTTWRALEWVTLVLALGHGGLGLDTLLRRGPWSAGTATALRLVSGAVIGLLAVAASVVVLTYR